MPLYEALRLALQTVWSHNLRSFFTLLGIIVSVAFLVAVVAVIQGMNAYARERLAGAIVGVNAFQVRRDPIQVGFIDDETWKQIQRRPIIAPQDVGFIERAVPDAEAIALQSGWPTPMADVQWRNRTTGDVFIFGVTAPYVLVQDYTFAAGEPLSDIDLQQRRYVAVLGYDVAEKLFGNVEAAVGSTIRVRGIHIMNIMLMSVAGRTRDIGLRVALGAARRDIGGQFFAEALTLSVLGVIAGIVVGFALAGLVEAISPLPARVTAWSIAIAIALGLIVGILFSVYPAHRASRLDPIESLRQE